ncbi:ATPase, T2SS/T4P/T4SS family [Desulfococcaceae bacterium HSG9]|nr:ATPase, T2SS/T4P/T4SS family [Desulfococcaceae bacterium HSG9]
MATPKKFGDWAIELGFMTEAQVNHILDQKTISSKRKIGQICKDADFLDDQQLAQILARQYEYDYISLAKMNNTDLFKLIPLHLMTQYQFIPVSQKKDRLQIAIAEPTDFFKIANELDMLLNMDISIAIASAKRIMALLDKFESSQDTLAIVSDDMRLPVVQTSETGETVLSIDKIDAEENPIVKLVNSTIIDAINKKASDIHIESSDQGMIIRYRIDGILYQAIDPLEVKYQSPVISRIKVMSELDIAEKRVPQDGRFKLRMRDRTIDFRISILPTIFGENAVIRILDSESMNSGDGELLLEEMQLPTNELTRIRRMTHAPYGLFLMTGPTGSGKTTTLYRALSEVNSNDVKIITIEDPVEYQLKGITQIQVNEKKGLTFAKGLRSVLRHDPDKVLVGEIRDQETAQIAIQAALTGHLVFTTVHANSSFEVINRFIHMGVEPYNLMSALNCIVAQRLIRTLCKACKIPISLSSEAMIAYGLNPSRRHKKKLYKANGCALCNGTGFKGRKAFIELIELDDDMKQLFIGKAPMTKIKTYAARTGAVFLREAALNEVLRGVTTLTEVNRVTFAKKLKPKVKKA